MASIVTAPEVYPDCVPVAAAPAIVPPVARIMMFGFFVCAETAAACASTAADQHCKAGFYERI